MNIEFKAICPYENIEKEYIINVNQIPFCEHRGDLENYDISIDDDGIEWCLNCKDEIEIPANMIAKAAIKSRELKIKYYKQKLKDLK